MKTDLRTQKERHAPGMEAWRESVPPELSDGGTFPEGDAGKVEAIPDAIELMVLTSSTPKVRNRHEKERSFVRCPGIHCGQNSGYRHGVVDAGLLSVRASACGHKYVPERTRSNLSRRYHAKRRRAQISARFPRRNCADRQTSRFALISSMNGCMSFNPVRSQRMDENRDHEWLADPPWFGWLGDRPLQSWPGRRARNRRASRSIRSTLASAIMDASTSRHANSPETQDARSDFHYGSTR